VGEHAGAGVGGVGAQKRQVEKRQAQVADPLGTPITAASQRIARAASV
jgi:hypothetical protein